MAQAVAHTQVLGASLPRCRRPQRCRRAPCPRPHASLDSATPDGLQVLPVFTGSTVLLPTSQGALRAFEPRYVAMFADRRRGDRFLHVLSPASAPPAMLDAAPPGRRGLPAVGCVAAIDAVTPQPDGSLIVEYTGHRRLALHLVDAAAVAPGGGEALTAAGEWYDDLDPGEVVGGGGVAGVAAAERDVAGAVRQIERLTRIVRPETARLPEALRRHAPPAPGAAARPTSYDALKASGHRAATAIETWRRSGSVYGGGGARRPAHADPYVEAAEALGRARRQELFSFAAAQLLQLGVPEAAALLLSRDTEGRLGFVLEAARPFLNELAAAAALKGALGERRT